MADSSVQRQDKYVLRLPDGMRDRIKSAAEANGRSMNAEIVARLEKPADAVDHKAVLDGLYAVTQRLARIEAQITRCEAAPSHHAHNIASKGGVLLMDGTAGMRRGL